MTFKLQYEMTPSCVPYLGVRAKNKTHDPERTSRKALWLNKLLQELCQLLLCYPIGNLRLGRAQGSQTRRVYQHQEKK
jgi:hypothetical protein